MGLNEKIEQTKYAQKSLFGKKKEEKNVYVIVFTLGLLAYF